MKKIAVVLSGCGVFDGAEIHEATLSLLAIERQGASYEVFAPDVDQHHVINHLTGEEMDEKRNVLIESARIARGQARDLKDYQPADFDGILFPGGFGAAKNLSSWAFKGSEAEILPEVKRVIVATFEAGKPIGALCISPVLLALVFGEADLTIGQDEATIEQLEKLGANHVLTKHDEVVVDIERKLVTNPCYMLEATITQIDEGANNVVDAMLKLMD